MFDKAYVHFKHLFSLTERGVFVTRAKDNMRYHVCKKRKVSGNILRDDEITLQTAADYPQRMRRIVARVEVDGKEVEMVFITNNIWPPALRTLSKPLGYRGVLQMIAGLRLFGALRGIRWHLVGDAAALFRSGRTASHACMIRGVVCST